jgi:hypothetical protein
MHFTCITSLATSPKPRSAYALDWPNGDVHGGVTLGRRLFLAPFPKGCPQIESAKNRLVPFKSIVPAIVVAIKVQLTRSYYRPRYKNN